MSRVDFSLYVVTDRHQTGGRPLVALLAQAVGAGLRAIQLREKDLGTRELLALCRELLSLARRSGARVLVNDRLDLVLAAGADGVHLRADSLPVSIARQLLGPHRLIGASAHSVEEVARAEADGADFVVLGPIYETASKMRYGPAIGLGPLAEATQGRRIPVFAIGGVTASRVPELRKAGAAGAAVISAVLGADSVESATHTLLESLREPI
jgi:thiamine-phosphate pyrophosphorylase